jgi:hypothetical protein
MYNKIELFKIYQIQYFYVDSDRNTIILEHNTSIIPMPDVGFPPFPKNKYKFSHIPNLPIFGDFNIRGFFWNYSLLTFNDTFYLSFLDMNGFDYWIILPGALLSTFSVLSQGKLIEFYNISYQHGTNKIFEYNSFESMLRIIWDDNQLTQWFLDKRAQIKYQEWSEAENVIWVIKKPTLIYNFPKENNIFSVEEANQLLETKNGNYSFLIFGIAKLIRNEKFSDYVKLPQGITLKKFNHANDQAEFNLELQILNLNPKDPKTLSKNLIITRRIQGNKLLRIQPNELLIPGFEFSEDADYPLGKPMIFSCSMWKQLIVCQDIQLILHPEHFPIRKNLYIFA